MWAFPVLLGTLLNVAVALLGHVMYSAVADTLLLSPESQTSLLTPAFNFGKNVALLCHFYYKCIFHLFLYVFISSMKVLYYGKMFTF